MAATSCPPKRETVSVSPHAEQLRLAHHLADSDLVPIRELFVSLKARGVEGIASAAEQEWSHVWASLHANIGPPSDDEARDGYRRAWFRMGTALGIVDGSFCDQVLRYDAPGGCSWFKCPLHEVGDVNALAVKMKRCTACNVVRKTQLTREGA